jgi:hypothetical protein
MKPKKKSIFFQSNTNNNKKNKDLIWYKNKTKLNVKGWN